ncbi:MAG: BlaI/MecI/CopY family transcriptional regulator [Terriglobales bacterium]|jgi:predicted transcriptional regulator
MGFFQRSQIAQLGPLEQKMMSALWKRGNATVREYIQNENSALAYTTVMTTLDRLYKKRLLDRSPEGRAFRYFPRYTQSELEREMAGETIRQLLSPAESSSVPLSYLVEAVSEVDAGLLDDLQRLVEEKRRALRNEASDKEKR